jgi:hypothetical protein
MLKQASGTLTHYSFLNSTLPGIFTTPFISQTLLVQTRREKIH